ncbi:MAG: M67 family metallopeptidase, partial [Gemmataceae bacterium]|nr:M67 family metallopeptidase [Gemmataceae bacterium]
NGAVPPFTRLFIPRPILDAMVAHARAGLPNECCGLLAGAGGRVTHHFPVRNDLASPTEFLTNPRDLLAAMKAARLNGAEVLAVYHSHPTAAPVPSRKDLERNTWGEAIVHVIVGLAGAEPEVRVWWLGERDYRPAEWAVADG